MNLDDIARDLAEINHEAQRGDFEAAHAAEDTLYANVLHAIAAMGSTDAAILARAALKSRDISFDRYCA